MPLSSFGHLRSHVRRGWARRGCGPARAFCLKSPPSRQSLPAPFSEINCKLAVSHAGLRLERPIAHQFSFDCEACLSQASVCLAPHAGPSLWEWVNAWLAIVMKAKANLLSGYILPALFSSRLGLIGDLAAGSTAIVRESAWVQLGDASSAQAHSHGRHRRNDNRSTDG